MKPTHREHTLHDYVQIVLKDYLAQLGDEIPKHLYDMVMNEAESALLKTIISHTEGNLSKTAEFLGINRATLRKKLKHYQIKAND